MSAMSGAAELKAEIDALMHAVQSAVKFRMEIEPAPGETHPKHLRVGVNSALIDAAAVAKVLIDKGIMTETEYLTALRDLWRREVESYQEWFAQRGYGHLTFA